MADDWQVGDLALCIKGGGPELVGGKWLENDAPYDLVAGRIYRVDRIDVVKGWVGLHFETYKWTWLAARFRKVTPPEADEFDREIIALMNGKPALEPAANDAGF